MISLVELIGKLKEAVSILVRAKVKTNFYFGVTSVDIGEDRAHG